MESYLLGRIIIVWFRIGQLKEVSRHLCYWYISYQRRLDSLWYCEVYYIDSKSIGTLRLLEWIVVECNIWYYNLLCFFNVNCVPERKHLHVLECCVLYLKAIQCYCYIYSIMKLNITISKIAIFKYQISTSVSKISLYQRISIEINSSYNKFNYHHNLL